MRIFTCTPVAFGGGEDFFSRDSGLLCRGLQAVGVTSRAVMPEPAREGDLADLIRAPMADLESAEWWRGQALDAVVLYAWGRPKFRKVARAIHEAGVFLMLNQDSGGLVSPRVEFWGWVQEQRNLSGGGAAWVKLLIKGLSYGWFITDPLRANHLRYGDVIACVSPRAVQRYRILCRHYGGEQLADRVALLPHAVEPSFTPEATPKRRRMISVGRWDDRTQKRPDRLMAVVEKLLKRDAELQVRIAGTATADMLAWWQGLESSVRERVALLGKVGRGQLSAEMAASQVFYSPSAYESFGIAAAEALCTGCSVVAEESVSMAAFEWFVSEESGTLAEGKTVASHVVALEREFAAWGQGLRDPNEIAKQWQGKVAASRVAAEVVKRVAARRLKV